MQYLSPSLKPNKMIGTIPMRTSCGLVGTIVRILFAAAISLPVEAGGTFNEVDALRELHEIQKIFTYSGDVEKVWSELDLDAYFDLQSSFDQSGEFVKNLVYSGLYGAGNIAIVKSSDGSRFVVVKAGYQNDTVENFGLSVHGAGMSHYESYKVEHSKTRCRLKIDLFGCSRSNTKGIATLLGTKGLESFAFPFLCNEQVSWETLEPSNTLQELVLYNQKVRGNFWDWVEKSKMIRTLYFYNCDITFPSNKSISNTIRELTLKFCSVSGGVQSEASFLAGVTSLREVGRTTSLSMKEVVLANPSIREVSRIYIRNKSSLASPTGVASGKVFIFDRSSWFAPQRDIRYIDYELVFP